MPMRIPSIVSAERSRWVRTASVAVRKRVAPAHVVTPRAARRRGVLRSPDPAVADLDRSARARAAMSCSWVISTIVRPSRLSSSSRSSTSAVEVESRLPVGSSARIIAGSVTSARAMATRCCWPPESSPGLWSARSARPTWSSATERPLASLGRCDAAVDQRQLDVAPRREVGEQVELLEHEADEAGCARRRAGPRRTTATSWPASRNDAGRRDVEAAEDVHQRRLARARRAGDRDELVLLDAQRHVAQRRDLERAGRVDLARRRRSSMTGGRHRGR